MHIRSFLSSVVVVMVAACLHAPSLQRPSARLVAPVTASSHSGGVVPALQVTPALVASSPAVVETPPVGKVDPEAELPLTGVDPRGERMDLAGVEALMRRMTGRRGSDGIGHYARAIVAATGDARERRILASVAFAENWFHLGSNEVPFGLSHWRSHSPMACRFALTNPRHVGTSEIRDCKPFSIAWCARLSIAALRFLVASPCARRDSSWPAVLGRYHHGVGDRAFGGGHLDGCYKDRLSSLQWCWANLRASETSLVCRSNGIKPE